MGFGVDKCARFAYNNPVTAEVAEAISIDSVGQLPDSGKGLSPKAIPDAKRVFPGAAQNMRGTVIHWMLCCRENPMRFSLCMRHRAFYLFEKR